MSSLSCSISLSQRQEPDMTGGASDSCLPEVEAWLQMDADHWKVLRQMAPDATLERYQSVVDFLAVHACPELKAPCHKFYAGKGDKLVDQSTEAQRRHIASRTLVLCLYAYELRCRDREASWGRARREALAIMEAA